MSRVGERMIRNKRPQANARAELVITGLGPVSAAGVGKEAFWEGLLKGGARPVVHEPRTEGLPVHPFPLYRIARSTEAPPPPRGDDLIGDPELELAAEAIRLALDDAGLDASALEDAALILTYEAPGLDRLLRGLAAELETWQRRMTAGVAPPDAAPSPEEAFHDFYLRHREAVYRTHSFLHLHEVAAGLGFGGPAFFVNNACASGLYGLETAADLLKAGKAPIAVVAAAEFPVFPAKYLWFRELGLYAPDGIMRPFDRRRSGLVFGEGAAAVVLETLEGAGARGIRPVVEYAGGALGHEGTRVVIPEIGGEGYPAVIRTALERAGAGPRDVDFIAAHGAATPLSDLYEAQALEEVFSGAAAMPPLTALKASFGHTLGASALLELVAAVLALERGALPPACGSEERDPRLAVFPVTQTTPLEARVALKTANGFAGFNAAAVLKRVGSP